MPSILVTNIRRPLQRQVGSCRIVAVRGPYLLLLSLGAVRRNVGLIMASANVFSLVPYAILLLKLWD
jgi:hypothetical protein